jgi:hypothetical protein
MFCFVWAIQLIRFLPGSTIQLQNGFNILNCTFATAKNKAG